MEIKIPAIDVLFSGGNQSAIRELATGMIPPYPNPVIILISKSVSIDLGKELNKDPAAVIEEIRRIKDFLLTKEHNQPNSKDPRRPGI